MSKPNYDSFSKGEPAAEPVTTAEIQEYCRILETQDATLVAALGIAARDAIEGLTNRLLINTTVVAYWRKFPKALVLPFAPVSSITSVKYYDADNDIQTLAATEYDTDLNHDPAYICPAYGKTWPDIYSRPDAVQVTYVVGYGATGDDVPEALKVAVKAAALDIYEFRGLTNEASDTRAWSLDNAAIHRLVNSYKREYV